MLQLKLLSLVVVVLVKLTLLTYLFRLLTAGELQIAAGDQLMAHYMFQVYLLMLQTYQ
jgi:hypothetical protein